MTESGRSPDCVGHRLISAPPSGRDGSDPEPGVIHIDSVDRARHLLRAKHRTHQAGFTAERIPAWLFRHRPILIDDGPEHDEHRAQLARFFAPQVLREQHGEFIAEAARTAVERARKAGSCSIDDLALHYSVRVASHIVGLTHGKVEDLSRRLTLFFQQPPVDHTKPDHGRTRGQWAQAARKALTPLIAFYFADVRPAIRARRRKRQSDIISHLLDRGYRSREILMECLTYGTAGMVTTREFISVALWHLLRSDLLCQRYLDAPTEERMAILDEIDYSSGTAGGTPLPQGWAGRNPVG